MASWVAAQMTAFLLPAGAFCLLRDTWPSSLAQRSLLCALNRSPTLTPSVAHRRGVPDLTGYMVGNRAQHLNGAGTQYGLVDNARALTLKKVCPGG